VKFEIIFPCILIIPLLKDVSNEDVGIKGELRFVPPTRASCEKMKFRLYSLYGKVYVGPM
jgi:hypothetical protein